MTVDLANSDKLLTTTRAVRKRIDFERSVERSVIEEAVEVALQAPTTHPQLCTQADRFAYPIVYPIHLCGTNQRTDFRRRVTGISHHKPTY